MRVAEWHFCPALSDTGSTEVVADIVAVRSPCPTRPGTPGAGPPAPGRPTRRSDPMRCGRELRSSPIRPAPPALGQLAAAIPPPAGETLCGVAFAIVTGVPKGADDKP
jgi:hypothetical protein